MAPITRSSLHGRPVDQPRQVRDSHTPPQHDEYEPEDESMVDDYGEAEDDDGEVGDSRSPYRSSAQEILRPLQATADRVAKQVEEFAQVMDQFVSTRKSDDETLWNDALLLLGAYNDICANRRSRTSTSDPETQIQKIQLEADLWLLVRGILSITSPEVKTRARIAQESRLGDLNRYSTNSTLWEAFLDSDSVAQHYECILDWLQEREASTGIPMDDIVRILNAKSNRGEGIWSAGPVYTQAAVKKQKRTRVLATPLVPSLSGLAGSHKRRDGEPLVSQLDPDAQTREDAVLEQEDEFHEQAAWRTYWEMLRRGQTPDQIQAWWAERKENWRYAEICGSAYTSSKMQNSPWLRIMSIASNAEWLERCEELSRDMDLDDYQRAVYGMISGNVSSSEPVNQTIDDHLFAIFNALLIERYQAYLQAYHGRLTGSGSTTYHPQPPSKTYLQRFFTEAISGEEARQPYKFLELAIVTKNFSGFLLDMGRAAAQVAHQGGLGSHLIHNDNTQVKPLAQISVRDPDTVRFVAHFQLVLQSLGLLDSAFTENEYVLENNIASYIAWLESEGKFSLIPVYVAKLSQARGEHVLASILVNISNHQERELQLKLIKQYKLDMSAIAYGVFTLANYDAIQRLRSADGPPTAPRITEPPSAGKPGQVTIKRNLMSGELSDDEEKAIRSVEWYRYVDAERWGSAAWSVSLLYKDFLYEGRFAALRQLLIRVSLSEISLSAVGMNLVFSDMEEPPPEPVGLDGDDTDEERLVSVSPIRKRKTSSQDHILTRAGNDRATLALKSRIWKELEELVAIIDGLEGFQEIVDDLDENRANPTYVRGMKRELRSALDLVKERIQALFDPDFLRQPQDEMEGVLLHDLRNHYIPDCILAYNSTLYFAGHALSRAYLVDCMDLAQLVATNPMLTAAFVESGRMKELVQAFALDSQALLRANEQGGMKAKRTKADQGNSEIWNVAWREQGNNADLEVLD